MEAFKKISEDKAIQMQEELIANPLFCSFSEVFDSLCIEDNDLSAVEVWNEALSVVSKLSKSKRGDLLVSRIRLDLNQKYSSILIGEHRVERSDQQANDTCIKVLTCVLYMICSCENWKTDYWSISSKIGAIVFTSPLFLELFKRQRISEFIEERNGNPVPNKDYLVCSLPDDNDDIQNAPYSERITIPDALLTCVADKSRFGEFARIINTSILPFIISPEGNAQLWEVVKIVAAELGYTAQRCSRTRFAQLLESICPQAGAHAKIQSNMEKYCKKGIELQNDLTSIRSRFLLNP